MEPIITYSRMCNSVLRDHTTARMNIVDALKTFDSRGAEMILQKPVPWEKILELGKKAQDLQGIPSFKREGPSITVSDPFTFDYSVLGESITSICIGLDQLLVGFDLEKLDHHAFETFAWYSSSFQFMDSIMSLHGVHFIPKPSAPLEVRETKKKVLGRPRPVEFLEFVEKRFEIPFLRGETDGVRWSFKSALPSHEARWSDFGKLLVSLIDSKKSGEIPKEVRDIYGYLKAVADFRAHRLEWRQFLVKFRNEGQFKSAILNFGKDIANIRHRAVYQNQTYDVFSYTMLEQGRKVDEFTNASRKFVKRFALSMARWSSDMLGEVWSHLKVIRPSPQRAIDWPDLACRYIPLQIALTEVRLEKIYNKKEIISLHKAIPDIITDIMASRKMHRLWNSKGRTIQLS